MTEIRRVRQLRELAKKAGLVVERIETRKHMRVGVVAGNGAKKTIIAAKTASDARADKNALAFMRRFANENRGQRQ